MSPSGAESGTLQGVSPKRCGVACKCESVGGVVCEMLVPPRPLVLEGLYLQEEKQHVKESRSNVETVPPFFSL